MKNAGKPELRLICGCLVVVSVPCCLASLWWPAASWTWGIDLFRMGGLRLCF